MDCFFWQAAISESAEYTHCNSTIVFPFPYHFEQRIIYFFNILAKDRLWYLSHWRCLSLKMGKTFILYGNHKYCIKRLSVVLLWCLHRIIQSILYFQELNRLYGKIRIHQFRKLLFSKIKCRSIYNTPLKYCHMKRVGV